MGVEKVQTEALTMEIYSFSFRVFGVRNFLLDICTLELHNFQFSAKERDVVCQVFFFFLSLTWLLAFWSCTFAKNVLALFIWRLANEWHVLASKSQNLFTVSGKIN